jgi:FixJ family two-component response regulator
MSAPADSLQCMGIPRFTIAVVDDDAGVRTALYQLLRSAGYDAVAFESAEEFLARAAEGDIHCLIADINLPGMSGVALAQTPPANGGPRRVILITGRDDPHTLELIHRAGGMPLLRKPFGDRELFDTIAATLNSSWESGR